MGLGAALGLGAGAATGRELAYWCKEQDDVPETSQRAADAPVVSKDVDLAGDPEADALTNNGQAPPSITGRLRSAADGAQAAADLVGAGAAGLAAAQAFRSQLPQDAAEYVRLNVLPRPGPQPQPPPQIIGRPDDVERLLDEAGQRAQEVERGAAQAIEETAAVAAEEGEVAVAAEGVGGAFGYLGGLAEGAAALAPTAGEVAGAMAATAGVGATAGLAVGLAGGAAYGLARGTGWVHALPASAGQRGRGRAGRPVRQQHERRHAAPALHAAHRQQHFGQPAELPGKLPQLGAVAPEPPASAELRPAGPRYRGGLDSPSPYERK